jgi:MFS family permease
VAACMNGSGTRSLTALYVAAPFSMGYVDFYTFLMPLYALSLGFNAAEVGILVGARSIVAMFLSIHIGVLMDRFGTRKVTLFFVWASMVLAPLFPLVPWFWSLLVLQLVNGAAVSFAWSGLRHSSAAGHRRGAPSWAVYILRPTRFDNCADARRRGVGFRRHLAVLFDRRRMGRRADRRLAVCPRV